MSDASQHDPLSFVKQLFFGRFDQTKIFPYPHFSSEERERTDLFTHKLRQFTETHIDPFAIDRESKIPEEIIQGLGKLGMLGLSVPQKFGGLGMSLTAYCKALEVISQRCGSTAAFLTAHQSIGYKAILLFGTEEQKQNWLPAIARGEVIAAFALTEPNAGSDANGLETKAIYDPKKNVYYLTGKKQWISNGSLAQILTVMAQTEIETSEGKEWRVTAFMVTPDMPGFKITESAQDKVGIRGLPSASLEFNNMPVPAENILGKLGEGLKVALSVLNYGRITIGATCAGPAKLLVDQVFKYARERHQFQQPLSSFSLVKKKLATLAALAYAIDAVNYLTAGKVDAGEKDFMLEAAIVKVFSTEALWFMIFETMQIFGGKAMFKDQPYELMMRDCRPSMIVEGSNDVMRMFIAMTGLKGVRKRFKALLEAAKNPFAAGANLRSNLDGIFGLFWPKTIHMESSLLQKEAKMLLAQVRGLGRAVLQFLYRYGDHVIDKQIILERIASIVIGIYTSAAVLSKIDADIERVQGNSELLKHDIETAQYFCRYTLKDVQQHLASFFDSNDDAAEHLADLITEDL